MKNIFLTLFLIFSCSLFSQEILGYWKTLNNDGNINSIVEIYTENSEFFGKIIAIPRLDYQGVCDTCTGKYKDKDLINVIILSNFSKGKETYVDGEVTDPENGKTYSCYLKLINEKKLKIRGYIGLAMFGRTEYWYRLNDNEKSKWKK